MSDSRKLAVLAALFIIFGCLASANLRRPPKVTTLCCTSVAKSRIPDKIISYTRQNALGSCVDAIIFQTKNNGKFCIDPNARWVPKKLKDRRLPKVTTTSVTSAIPEKKIRDEIISYTHQNASGPGVDAIIFQTENIGKVCTDPNARWVPKKLKELQKQS